MEQASAGRRGVMIWGAAAMGSDLLPAGAARAQPVPAATARAAYRPRPVRSADGVRLAKNGAEAVVRAVEYQGGHVALTARLAGDQEILALIPEGDFFADPKSPGDAVRLAWDEGRLHRLHA